MEEDRGFFVWINQGSPVQMAGKLDERKKQAGMKNKQRNNER